MRDEIRSEKGATAVLVAFCLTLLFLFAAIAIDAAGFGFNERRQDQSAADVASLAAVQFAVPTNMGNAQCAGLSGLALSRCNGAVEAIEVANATLDDPSLADWTDPAKCDSPPTGYALSSVTNCVAFTANNQRAWVRIPTIERPTTMARVVGVDSISISADAIAGAGTPGVGRVLPFMLPGIAASADYECLKAGANPNFGPCEDLPGSGNFGAMDFLMYGDSELGYTTACGGNELDRFDANVARGVDHPLSLYSPSVAAVVEQAHCPDFSAQPNSAFSRTGNLSLEKGMLYGGTQFTSPSQSYPGRIGVSSGGAVIRRSHPSGTPAARVDDTPLWTFLKSGLPAPCASGAVDTPDEMIGCINWAKATGTEVFNDNLASSKRFGFTPSAWQSEFSPGSSLHHFKAFIPVYIDTTWFGCQANKCTIMHTPGVSDSGACPTNPTVTQIRCGTEPPNGGDRNAELRAVTAYILDQAIVAPNAKSPAPGDPNQRSFNLID